MAGHSKWANIKHRKGSQDAKKSKSFQKYTTDILIAIKEGGGNPETNSKLKMAIDKAKVGNLPNDNIKRLLERGNRNNAHWQEIVYEGYGVKGTAIIVECLSDNTNRTAAQVKSSFTKVGGKLGTSGSVSYMFNLKGVIAIDPKVYDPNKIMEIAIECDVLDIKESDDAIVIETTPKNLDEVQKKFIEGGITDFLASDLVKVSDIEVELSKEEFGKLNKLIDALENCEDVQNVYTNAK